MDQAVHVLKKNLRKILKARLGNLPNSYRAKSSQEIFQRVEQLDVYVKSTAIFCYLSMPEEVQTMEFIDRCLMEGKRIFVPKVLDGRNMQVLEVLSLDDIEKFPKSRWGIPEPPADLTEAWKLRAYAAIDLVIVPGMGFDSSCQRIGHGKGYYDTFFATSQVFCQENGKEYPTLLGVSFEEQLVEEVPISGHDRRLDYVVTPSDMYSYSHSHSPPHTAMEVDEVDTTGLSLSPPPDSISTTLSSVSVAVGMTVAGVVTEEDAKKEMEDEDEVEEEEEDSCNSSLATGVAVVASSSSSSGVSLRAGSLESKTGWAKAFAVAAKVGEEGDGCLLDFMPPDGGGRESGGFRQPNTLASFVSRQSSSQTNDPMEEEDGNKEEKEKKIYEGEEDVVTRS